MIKEDVYERMNEIFRDIFDDDAISVNAETVAEDIEEWDSLEHINLIVAIEKEFGMKFTLNEVTNVKNVGEMAVIILERGTR